MLYSCGNTFENTLEGFYCSSLQLRESLHFPHLMPRQSLVRIQTSLSPNTIIAVIITVIIVAIVIITFSIIIKTIINFTPIFCILHCHCNKKRMDKNASIEWRSSNLSWFVFVFVFVFYTVIATRSRQKCTN